jgi:hypothetical protein
MRTTVDGIELIRAFDAAQRRVKSAEDQAYRAQSALTEAKCALGEWLVPKDATIGDVFCLAVGDAFLEVRVIDRRAFQEGGGEVSLGLDYVVGWRNGVAPRKGL